MDDRQPVSLARRALSYLICYLVAVQPMLPVMAAQITPVTPGTKMDAAGNGVPVVNIATPNGAGVSHNQYQQYNVGQEGLILNNATGQLNQTQLGGLIQNNPNLKAGQEAKAIINEVTGANRSQLQGYTEVAGKAASVMVANPYGITCNGCGFINTPNVTLTTGKPQLDASGNLSALEVTKGTVTVEGKGLDGSSADAVSIVARATEINAGIYAKDLSVTAGANRVGADGSVTPIAGEGTVPSVAVDTGALGGMYANRIHLVSSEQGVGVNLGNLAAKQGDIQLEANGKLTLGNAQSSGDVTVTAQDVVLSGEQQVASALKVQSRGEITLKGSKLSAGTLNADAAGTLTLDTNSAATTGGNAALSAGRVSLTGTLSSGNGLSLRTGQLTVAQSASVSSTGDSNLEVTKEADWQGTLTAGGDLSMNAVNLANKGQLSANHNTTITAQQINNSGRIQAKGDQTLRADTLQNSGTLQAGGAQSLVSQTFSSSGTIAAQQGLNFDVADGLTLDGSSTGNLLTISAGQTTLSGSAYGLQGMSLQGDFSGLENSQLLSGANLTLNGTHFSLAGLVSADNQLEMNADTLTSSTTAQTQAQNALTGHFHEATLAGNFTTPGALHFNVGTADNRASFSGETIGWQGRSLLQHGSFAADQNLDLKVGTTDQRGSLQAGHSLSITGDTLSNSGSLSAADLQATLSGELHNSGSFITDGLQTLSAAGFDNSGTLAASDVYVSSADISNSGRLQASRSGELSGNVRNQTTGVIVAGGSLDLHGNTVSNNGRLQAQALQLDAGDLRNGGSVLATGPLTLTTQNQLVNTGQLMSQQDAQLSADSVDNQGDILSQGALTLSAPTVINSGKMQSDGLNITGSQLSNSGDLNALKDIALQLQQEVINAQSGQVLAGNDLTINAASLTNAGKLAGIHQLSSTSSGTTQQLAGGQMLSSDGLLLTAAQLTNAGQLQAQDMQLRGGGFTNSGQLSALNSLDGQFTGVLEHQAAGSLFSQNSLLLSAKTLNNAGSLQASGAASLTADTLTNRGTLVTGGKLSLQLPVLVNLGWLQASQLDYRGNSLSNGGTLLSDNAGEYHFTSLDNSGTLQGRDVTLSGQTLTNNGTLMATHQLNATADRISNSAGGRILSAGGAALTGTVFSQLGQIAALGDAVLKVSDAFTQRGTLAAGGHLQLNSTGNLTIEGATQGNQITLSSDGSVVNNNRLQGGSGPLNVSAASITNSASGSIQSGGAATLTSRSSFINNGFIGAAGDVLLNSAGQLLNTALLYSAGNMRLFSASLNNLRGDVLADNSLTIARNASGQANDEVVNTSGNIETGTGDITISTGHLLNQRDGYAVTEESHQYFDGSTDHITLTYGDFSPDQYYMTSDYRCVGSGNNCSNYWSVNLAPEMWQRDVLVSETVTGATASGGAGRIASGRNLSVYTPQLDNNASSVLSEGDMSLSGGQLNNASATSGRYQTWQSYDCSASGSPLTSSCSSHLQDPHVDKSIPINFYLTGAPEYVSVQDGSSFRAVIQAGGNLSANFSQNISNTSLTANAGSIGQPTIQKPVFSSGTNTGAINGQQAKSLSQNSTLPGAATGWQESLKNALGSLGNSAASLGDYPIPSSNSGLFVPANKPDSPYLIVTNPNIAGLGKLDNSLFKGLDTTSLIAPQEVRSQFTDPQQYLGSSYFLDRLNLKPESDYRFLGDAAFDTRYVSNAVLSQTGQRYISGVGSDLGQMQTLIDNAAQQQQSLGLQLGVSLTPEQVAALTESIVWWETVDVDGQKVLAPKLYLATQDVKPLSGSTIVANNVSLKGGAISNAGSSLLGGTSLSLTSDSGITNVQQGAISSNGALNLSALDDIRNIGSSISGQQVALESTNGSIINQTQTRQWTAAGSNFARAMLMSRTETGVGATISAKDSLKLNAGQDIDLLGSTISSGGDMALQAGNDVRLLANQTLTEDSTTNRSGTKESGETDFKRSVLSSGGNLTLVAGQDITSQAAALAAEGDIGLQAGRDINLNAAESGSGDSEHGSKKTVIHETVRQQGTEIVSGGSTTLLAGNDITSQAATVTANKDLALQAGHDVNITTATESDYAYREETKTSKGLFSKKTTHTISEDSSTTEKASSLSGDHVSIVAGHDLAVSGSSVVGESDVGLKAGNDLSITAATETQSSYRLSETKKSGMFSGGGIGVTFGSASSKQELKQDGTTESQSASTIGSTDGNVTLVAGHDAHIAGSDVIAKQDISVVGGSVTIDPGNDTLTRRQSFEQKQSGLTLQLTSPITDALLSLGSQAKAASEAGDDRLKALGAVKVLESGWAMSGAAGQSATALANGNMREAGIKISLSVGASKSKSSSEYNSNTVSGSSLSGGGNVAVVATGANGTSGDVTLAGSGITGNNVTLAAAHDLNLVAASNNTEQKSSNKSSGWSAGVHVAIGQSTGIGVQASGYMASGSENGSSTQYVNSRVNAKDNLTLSSGNDTLLSGAQALGNSISVNAGNNLTLTSQQDTDSYHSQQQSASGGFSFTFGTMTGSFGLSLSKSKVNSEYASVGDQSGLFAGDGGYDIFVGNHTQLNGAVIASTADAANNKLSTGTLGWDSIDNHAEYSANSTSVGISGGYDSRMASGQQFAGSALPTSVNMHEKASGTTRSAVAEGAITVRDTQKQTQDVADLSRDTENANGSIGKIFDKEKVANQMAFAQGVQELAGKVVGDVKAYKLDAASAETKARLLKEHPEYASLSKEDFSAKIQNDPGYKAVADLWGTGGTYSMVATAVAGALGGLSANNLGAAAGGAMAPYIANAIKQATTTYNADGTENVNLLANTMAHAVAGAVLAQMSGSSAAAGAAGAAGGELTARAIIAVMYPNTQVSDLTETQKQMVSSLSQLAAGLAGGIASNSSMGIGSGAGAGKNAVENNTLGSMNSHPFEEEHAEHAREVGDRSIHLLTPNPGLEPKRDEHGNPITYAPGAFVPIRPTSLPTGYSSTSAGEIVGPKGGVYANTGKSDSNGNTIYSNSGGYYIFNGSTKVSVESPNASNQIRNNYNQGKAFEDEVYNKYASGQPESAREITIKTDSGTNVRVDILTKDGNGGISCIECKSSPTAPLTQNQKLGYPELEKNGGTIVGTGKPGFEGGTKIPPTQVIIVRPEDKRE